MEKTIIAGVAALLLSAGAAVAQSASDQNHMNAGTSATAGASSSMPSNGASATKKVRTATAHYPKGEAKLNAEEAQQTKDLNLQESQAVASNSSAGNSSAMNSTSAGMTNSSSTSQPK